MGSGGSRWQVLGGSSTCVLCRMARALWLPCAEWVEQRTFGDWEGMCVHSLLLFKQQIFFEWLHFGVSVGCNGHRAHVLRGEGWWWGGPRLPVGSDQHRFALNDRTKLSVQSEPASGSCLQWGPCLSPWLGCWAAAGGPGARQGGPGVPPLLPKSPQGISMALQL